jgi:hypothetical protein
MGGQLSQVFPKFVRFFKAFTFFYFLIINFLGGFVYHSFVCGTHKNNVFVKPFHALAHCFSGVFPLCLFPSLAYDAHILSPTHVISFVFDHFVF